MTRTERLRAWLSTRRAKAVIGVLGVLVLARLALPWVAQTVINDRLSHMDGYAGRVLGVDVSLWRGAYTLHDLMIERIDAHVPAPFVQAAEIDIAVEWRALFRGKIVAELVVDHPIVNFVGGRTPQTGAGTDWRHVVDDLVPITINHLAIHHGEIHYRDFSARPVVDVVAGNLEIEATGLSTVHDDAVPLPAHVALRGTVQRRGQLRASADLDPWAERPTFELDLAMEHLPAPELNRFLRAYADIDAEAGQFYLYSQIHSRDGTFDGYVKPMVEGLSLFRAGEPGDVVQQTLDLFVQVAIDIFENHGTDRFGTRVAVSGSFDSPGVDGWEAIVGILSNMFIRAVTHGLDRPRDAWVEDHSHSPVHG